MEILLLVDHPRVADSSKLCHETDSDLSTQVWECVVAYYGEISRPSIYPHEISTFKRFGVRCCAARRCEALR